jgi:hypothetical protein
MMSVKITTTARRQVIGVETKKLKRALTLFPLVGLIYFTVSGGSFGIEPLVGYAGPGLALVLIALMLLGAALYFPIHQWIKPGVPDVDPFVASEEDE